jgi:hypothetical protein
MDLLKGMDTSHPKVLKQHGVVPGDYHGALVFRSAVESIRGSYIASSTVPRQAMVAAVLAEAARHRRIYDFAKVSGRGRLDFEVVVDERRETRAAVEVKGGEGNSISISDRPLWADEFLLWCHLDGSIKNQPAEGAGAIIFNRLASEVVKRRKQVDVLVVKDQLCGTPARPCPKRNPRALSELGVPPCVFLMPRRVPHLEDPSPPPHDLGSVRIARIVLGVDGVSEEECTEHTYSVKIGVDKDDRGRLRRRVSVYKGGRLLEERSTTR